MKFKEGDYVRIIEREAAPADAKTGTFYPYFCGLAGTVDRVYGKEVCVKVEPSTLPEDVLKRHLSIQESMRRKWLNGLSGEARNRLTPAEKRFELAYTVLVQSADLEKIKSGRTAAKSARAPGPPKAAREAAAVKEKAERVSEKADAPKPSGRSRKPASAKAAEPAPAKRAARAARETTVKPSPAAQKPVPKAIKPAGKPAAKAAPKRTAQSPAKAESKPKSTETTAKPKVKAAAKSAAKPAGKAAPKAAAAKSAAKPAAKPSAKAAAKPAAKAAVKPQAKAPVKAPASRKSAKPAGAGKRAPKDQLAKSLTSADLEAAEAAFLKERAKALKGGGGARTRPSLSKPPPK